MSELVFPDPAGYADLATLVGRVRAADPDAAVRLRAGGTTLQVWVGVLPGSGLLADGAALGVRGVQLAEPAQLDVVVGAAGLADRLGLDAGSATRLTVPSGSVFAPWAGALPGPSGWVSVGRITVARLDEAARAGIAEIAAGARGSVGSHAVVHLRAVVWRRGLPLCADPVAPHSDRTQPDQPQSDQPQSDQPQSDQPQSDQPHSDRTQPDRTQPAGAQPAEVLPELPAAGAFAAYVLGFLRGSGQLPLPVYRQGRWWRLRTPAGHVLVR